METIDLIVCYSDDTDNPKGIITAKQFERMTNKGWIHHSRQITVDKADWDAERIHIGNVREMIRQYEVRQLRESMPWMGDQLAGLFGLNQ